jgi:sugar phosphate isomerase/epimerase
MKIEAKEEALNAFATGHARVIITKPSIAGYGVNWQHCANVAFVGRTFSYEAWYQAVRRCWRFGQKSPVQVHLAVAEGEDQIGRVIDRKSADHAMMKRAMADAMRRAGDHTKKTKLAYEPNHKGRLPTWLSVA